MAALLVIDDDVAKMDTIEGMLSDAGHEVISAHDAGEALDKFNDHKPDLIIAERNLLLSNETKLLEKIQQSKYYRHVPILLISASYMDMTAVFNRDIGRYDRISYPVDVDELLYKVISLLKHKEIFDDLYSVRTAFEAIDRDVTERKRAEQQMLSMQRRLNAQWEIARMVDADWQTICDRVLEEIVSVTHSEYGFYGVMNEDESMFMIDTWSDGVMKDCGMDDKPIKFPIDQAGLWANAVTDRKTLIVNDYTEDVLDKNGLPIGHIKLKRLMVVPIMRNNDIVAVGAVANKAEDYGSSE